MADPDLIDQLAQHIRFVDGSHTAGAAALAEAVLDYQACDARRRERALDAAVAYHFAARAAAHAAVIGSGPDRPVLSERAHRIVRRQYEGVVDAILAAVDGAPPPSPDVTVAVSPASDDQEEARDRDDDRRG